MCVIFLVVVLRLMNSDVWLGMCDVVSVVMCCFLLWNICWCVVYDMFFELVGRFVLLW